MAIGWILFQIQAFRKTGVATFIEFALMGKSPFLGDWLGWEVVIMGLIVAGSLSLRLTPGGDFTDALARLRKEGSNDDTERSVSRSLLFVYPELMAIHGEILASIFISTMKF